MTVTEQISTLNDVLIETGRSLLQYLGECWPWTEQDADAVLDQLNQTVAEQQKSIGALITMINSRTSIFDLGSFPTEYTDLHFVALDYVLVELVANQRSVVIRIERAVIEVSGDAQAKALLKKILATEQKVLEGVRKIADSSK